MNPPDDIGSAIFNGLGKALLEKNEEREQKQVSIYETFLKDYFILKFSYSTKQNLLLFINRKISKVLSLLSLNMKMKRGLLK